jgi:hypothetical protein
MSYFKNEGQEGKTGPDKNLSGPGSLLVPVRGEQTEGKGERGWIW